MIQPEAVNYLGPQVGFGWLLTILPIVIFIVLPLYLVIRFLRAYERRGRVAVSTTDADARVAALEAEVAMLAQQVEQMKAGQQFDSQLRERLPNANAFQHGDAKHSQS